jgi:hypothetical protein
MWGGTSTHYKVDGVITENGQQIYKIHGNWNSQIFVTKFLSNNKPDLQSEICVFQKNTYPENWKVMYGMSHFSLQLNYFPSWLKNSVSTTDTRRRPDQRHLENGDFIEAAKEKDRLENKQR